MRSSYQCFHPKIILIHSKGSYASILYLLGTYGLSLPVYMWCSMPVTGRQLTLVGPHPLYFVAWLLKILKKYLTAKENDWVWYQT